MHKETRHPTLRAYLRQLWRVFWDKKEWARDTFIVPGILGVLTIAIVIFIFHHKTSEESLAYLYAIGLGLVVFLAVKVLASPWRRDQEREAERKTLNDEIDKVGGELATEKLKNLKPSFIAEIRSVYISKPLGSRLATSLIEGVNKMMGSAVSTLSRFDICLELYLVNERPSPSTIKNFACTVEKDGSEIVLKPLAGIHQGLEDEQEVVDSMGFSKMVPHKFWPEPLLSNETDRTIFEKAKGRSGWVLFSCDVVHAEEINKDNLRLYVIDALGGHHKAKVLESATWKVLERGL